MEDTQTQTPANELEVIQVLGINARGRVDLEGVVIVRRILKETIEGIEHLV